MSRLNPWIAAPAQMKMLVDYSMEKLTRLEAGA